MSLTIFNLTRKLEAPTSTRHTWVLGGVPKICSRILRSFLDPFGISLVLATGSCSKCWRSLAAPQLWLGSNHNSFDIHITWLCLALCFSVHRSVSTRPRVADRAHAVLRAAAGTPRSCPGASVDFSWRCPV